MGDVGRAVLVHGAWGSPEMWRDVTDAVGVVPYEIRIADLPTTNGADATFADDVVHVRSLVVGGEGRALWPLLWVHGDHRCGGGSRQRGPPRVCGRLGADDGETSAEWFAKRPSAVRLSLTILDDGRDLPQGLGHNPGTYSPEVLARIRSIELLLQAVFPTVRISDPAWRRVPSTFVVATGDSLIHPDNQRETASRANAQVVELDCDHMVNLAAPVEVAAVLNAVVASVSSTSG